jgi:hypothetical protein
LKRLFEEVISYLKLAGYGDLTSEDPRLRERVSDITMALTEQAYKESEDATFESWAKMGYNVRPLSTEELRDRLSWH